MISVIGLDLSLTAPAACVLRFDEDRIGTAKIGDGLHADTASFGIGKNCVGMERVDRVSISVLSWLSARIVAGKWPAMAAIEGYAFSRSHAHSMGELGGVIKLELYRMGVPMLIAPPSTLKKFVAEHGFADKNVVMKWALKRWGFDVDDDDRTDAFCASMLGAFEAARRAGVEIPKRAAETLKKCEVIDAASVSATTVRGGASTRPVGSGPVRRRARPAAR